MLIYYLYFNSVRYNFPSSYNSGTSIMSQQKMGLFGFIPV
jgi:hypothetical protein